uniref:Uncharacterized protein n=1 Tax=Cryptomonas curvata TaxID=233186 RepID=A0A7S0MVI7_9CRYP
MTMCQSAVVNRTHWFRSALAAASGFNRLDLVKLRYPSLCNFAKKLPEKEGNSDPKLVSCKYWDTTVEMLMVGISVILSAPDQKTDAWKTEGIIYSFPASKYHLMHQLEESIHFATNRHLPSPVSKTVLNDDVISCTAGMQTLWTEGNDNYPAFTNMQITVVANSKLTDFINHRTGIGGSFNPHLLDTVPSSGAARRRQQLIRRSTRALHGEGRVRRDRLLYSCRTTRRRRGNDLPALRTWI